MGRTKYITSDKGPNGKILYSINAKEEIDPSLWDNFEMVKIRGRKKPEAGELTGGSQVGYSPLTGIPTGLIINISKYIPVSLQVKREGECEEKFPVEGGGNEAQKSDEKIISPTGRVKRPVNSENQQQAMVVGGCNHTCNPPVTVPVTDPVEQKPATGGGCSDPVKEPVDSERGDDYQSIAENLAEDRRRQAEEAERTATPPPKPKCDEGRAPTIEEAEALEVARAIIAAGKRVTFGNVEDYLEKRAGGYVEPKMIKRFLNALASQGWTTDKEGALSEGVVE